MSGFEAGVYAAAGAVLLGLALLGGAAALVRRWRHAERRLAQLEAELALYCEASHRVARTLEEMLLSRVQPAGAAHTSRRYLINQARERLEAGDSLPRVKRALGLSFDEARLLERSALKRQASGSALEPAA
jgi:hypothetical protein